MFKREWLSRIVEVAPANARRVRYWDKAGSAGKGAATSGVLMSRTPSGLYYVEDSITGQWASGARNRVMQATAKQDADKHHNTVRIWHEQEPGSGGKESAEFTNKLLSGHPVRADKVSGDKDTRLDPFAAQCEAGNVYLVRGAWNAAYVEELCAIPNGVRRDQGDASAGAFNKLQTAVMTSGDVDWHAPRKAKRKESAAQKSEAEIEAMLNE